MPFIGNKPTAVPLSGADIEDGTIGLADLSATGTKDATTFLRGDNTFASAGGGKVLQVVSATDATQRTTTSTSFVTASNTLSVNITPSSTSSKILILASSMIYISAQYRWLETTIFRGGSNILSSNGASGIYGGADNGGSVSINYLDSPASTSALTYDLRLRTNNADTTAYLNYSGSTGSIIALEIGA